VLTITFVRLQTWQTLRLLPQAELDHPLIFMALNKVRDKDELSAIEQWFRVLSEAERTAALYALLQQTTQVQIRFFIQVLQQMGKNHPMSGVLSPSNFDKGNQGSSLAVGPI